MRGNTLTNILAMTKAEMLLDSDDSLSPGGDDNLKAQLSNMQKWLALRYDWPFLQIYRNVATVAGTRYYDFPMTATVQDFELGRELVMEHYWSTLYYPMQRGISIYQYDQLNPVLNQRCDPISRWQFYNGGTLQFEVWPVPATAGSIRITGQKTLAAFATGTDTAELDDLLIAQFTAAKLMTRMKQGDAQALLAEANNTLQRLMAGYTTPSVPFSMNGMPSRERRDDTRPLVGVNYTP